jgi:prepilin-type N-terminal cleavage/methylation domain-containing protein
VYVPGHHHITRVCRRGADRDEGFTLIEMVIAIALSAFVFMALAYSLMAGMRSLAIAKARTRGNEVATQGIEDLQRFSYAQLGICGTPPSNPPADLGDPVQLTGGCNGTVEDSCNNQSGTVISYSYTCSRNGIAYAVNRYIAWSDGNHTVKRLAVFVNWTDAVGVHTVSQQSSVRAPDLASIIGLAPPSMTNPAVNGTTGNVTVLTVAGQLASDVTLDVDAANLRPGDQVMGVFYKLDQYGNSVQESVQLTGNAAATHYAGSIPASAHYTFGTGTQYILFTALRLADGKQAAAISTSIVTFCSGTCTSLAPPSFINGSFNYPSNVGIYPSGALKASFTVSVQTLNTTATDSVNFAVMTQSGLLTMPLQVDQTRPCQLNGNGCYWKATITASSGYPFVAGQLPLYFTIQQDKSTDPTSVDQGQTLAVSTAPSLVTFS